MTNLSSYDFRGSSYYDFEEESILLNKETDPYDQVSEIPGRSGAVYSRDFVINSNTHKKTSEVIVIPEGQPLTIEGRSTTNCGSFPHGRTVTLTPFIMGQYEVTKELFTTVFGVDMKEWIASKKDWKDASEVAGDLTENQDLRPAYSLNLYMAISFCNKLSILQGLEPCYTVEGVDFETLEFDDIPWGLGGKPIPDDMKDSVAIWNAYVCDYSKNGYRLPTEAEWECAARGGSYTYASEAEAASLGGNDYWNYQYPGTNSNDAAPDYIWGATNAKGSSHEVGLKKPNFINIYDMCGNSVEWCSDWQNSTERENSTTSYETEGPYTDPVVSSLTDFYSWHTLKGSLYTTDFKGKNQKIYKRDGNGYYYDSRAFRGVRLVRRFSE